jgi:hypothetical protein
VGGSSSFAGYTIHVTRSNGYQDHYPIQPASYEVANALAWLTTQWPYQRIGTVSSSARSVEFSNGFGEQGTLTVTGVSFQ